MQKYENGARRPKPDLLKQIASALGVSTLALTDPNTASYIGAMFAFFELEEKFNMKIVNGPEDQAPSLALSVKFTDRMYEYMKEWFDECESTQSQLAIASSDEEKEEILKAYHNWEWNFPKGIADKCEKDLKKARLRRKIQELQEAYDRLD